MVIYHGSCDWSCKRGCIAETLSALVLAAEVDNAARLDGVYSLLADKTRTIALEEPDTRLWRGVLFVGYAASMKQRVMSSRRKCYKIRNGALQVGSDWHPPRTMMSERRGLAFTKPSSTRHLDKHRRRTALWAVLVK
jgi:hypothetical protein